MSASGKPCSPDCPVCNRPVVIPQQLDAITAQMRQDAYQSDRAAWREHYLTWLADRELPGTPATIYVPDPLATDPTRYDPILGAA